MKQSLLPKYLFRFLLFIFVLQGTANSKAQTNMAGLIGFATENGGTTGGSGGTDVTVTSFADLKKYAELKDVKYRIFVKGRIYNGTKGAAIRIASNKSLIGLGSDALLDGIGIGISSTKNIIIQNIKFTMTSITDKTDPAVYSPTGDEGRPQILVNSGDCIGIQGTSSNIWIDHCEFYNTDPSQQTNQDLYDGLIDAKNGSAYITISWCYFHDHHKCHLIGSSDTDKGDRKITFHHNYYKNINDRMPLYRFGTGHFFNNYVFGTNSGSAVNSRMGACVRVENNVFENRLDPVVTKNSTIDGQWDLVGNSNSYVNCKGNQPTTSNCTFNPTYAYVKVLNNTSEVKALVIKSAGVGQASAVTAIENSDDNLESVTIFPNPSSNGFEIVGLNETYQYDIVDQFGVIINNGQVSNGMKIGENLAPGSYIVRLKNINDLKIVKINKVK